MRIAVETPTQRITLEVEPDESIEDVKARIREATSIPTSQQRLALQNAVLKDERLVRRYDIRDGSVLRLTIPIRIVAPDDAYNLNVTERTTIAEIKRDITQRREASNKQRREFVIRGEYGVLKDEDKAVDYDEREFELKFLSVYLHGTSRNHTVHAFTEMPITRATTIRDLRDQFQLDPADVLTGEPDSSLAAEGLSDDSDAASGELADNSRIARVVSPVGGVIYINSTGDSDAGSDVSLDSSDELTVDESDESESPSDAEDDLLSPEGLDLPDVDAMRAANLASDSPNPPRRDAGVGRTATVIQKYGAMVVPDPLEVGDDEWTREDAANEYEHAFTAFRRFDGEDDSPAWEEVTDKYSRMTAFEGNTTDEYDAAFNEYKDARGRGADAETLAMKWGALRKAHRAMFRREAASEDDAAGPRRSDRVKPTDLPENTKVYLAGQRQVIKRETNHIKKLAADCADLKRMSAQHGPRAVELAQRRCDIANHQVRICTLIMQGRERDATLARYTRLLELMAELQQAKDELNKNAPRLQQDIEAARGPYDDATQRLEAELDLRNAAAKELSRLRGAKTKYRREKVGDVFYGDKTYWIITGIDASGKLKGREMNEEGAKKHIRAQTVVARTDFELLDDRVDEAQATADDLRYAFKNAESAYTAIISRIQNLEDAIEEGRPTTDPAETIPAQADRARKEVNEFPAALDKARVELLRLRSKYDSLKAEDDRPAGPRDDLLRQGAKLDKALATSQASIDEAQQNIQTALDTKAPPTEEPPTTEYKIGDIVEDEQGVSWVVTDITDDDIVKWVEIDNDVRDALVSGDLPRGLKNKQGEDRSVQSRDAERKTAATVADLRKQIEDARRARGLAMLRKKGFGTRTKQGSYAAFCDHTA